MRKNILELSFVLMSSLLLAACGSQTPASSAPSSSTATSSSASSAAATSSLSSTPVSSSLVSSSSATPLLKEKVVQWYQTATVHSSGSLYFEDALPGVPFMTLESARELLVATGQASSSTFDITTSTQNQVVTWTREKANGSQVVFDFAGKTVTFSAFEAFSAMSYASTSLDPVSLAQRDSSNNALFINHDAAKSALNHSAETLRLKLSDYTIPMVYEGNEGYIPLQFFSDFFASQTLGILLYNGSSVFVLSSGALGEMSNLFYSTGAKSRSADLIDYNYHELCLALDVYYGLKDQHGITDFDSYLTGCGLKDKLLSSDAAVASGALMELSNWHFEDFHSGFISPSSYAGVDSVKSTSSPDMIAQGKAFSLYRNTRIASLGKTPDSYSEQGDTAFVTFDHFTALAADYYTTPVTEVPKIDADAYANSPDTFAVVTYAHKQITRTGSPIKNVVIDLSCNGGGALDALAYISGWLMDEDILDVKSTASGIRAENYYQVDTNLDKAFDQNDKISDKQLYCLISPNSFSCGNYLPSMLKIRQKATLIGQTSGGGGCMVKPLSTADGTLFQISGNMSMVVAHNGSFVDIDQGMEPDYRLGDPASFYDRVSLAQDIDAGVYGRITTK
jgi:uncharacterized protein YcfL